MYNKQVIFSIFVTAIIFIASCGPKSNYKARLKTDDDSASYYLGYFFAGQVNPSIFEDFGINPNAMTKGILELIDTDIDSIQYRMMEAQQYLNDFFMSLQKRIGEKNLKEGENWLEENKKKEGVDETPSGLQYKVLKNGTGEKAAFGDMVRAVYHGTLIDGKIFDSSKDRNDTVTFNIGRGMIQGFNEALTMMNEGSKWEVYIPAHLAYGEQGDRGIKPNTILIFELDVVEVIKPEPEPEP